MLAALEANGQLDNTLIVYTGDHGLNCGQHGVWEKGIATLPQNFLEESVRIACTVSWPAGGIQQNIVCEDLVNHCDLWATLLDVAGATPDAKTAADINSPGRSYLPQLRGHRRRLARRPLQRIRQRSDDPHEALQTDSALPLQGRRFPKRTLRPAGRPARNGQRLHGPPLSRS